MFFVEPDIKTVARKAASDNLRFIAYIKGSKEVKKGVRKEAKPDGPSSEDEFLVFLCIITV